MISKEEVLKIAGLARLELSKEEVIKMQKDLSEILDYFNLLEKAQKPKEDLILNESVGNKSLRQDEEAHFCDKKDEIMSAAPDKKDDYIKVKAIL